MAMRSGMRPGDPWHPTPTTEGFVHEALFYRGLSDFLSSTTAFIEGALAADEPILVAVSDEKINCLRYELGSSAADVEFVDMAVLGHNPARIIPAWRNFLDRRGTAAASVRGVGEPIWAARSAVELVECHRHEALLNVAFENARAFTLMCPYDADALPTDVVEAAVRNHPYVRAATEFAGTIDRFRCLSSLRPTWMHRCLSRRCRTPRSSSASRACTPCEPWWGPWPPRQACRANGPTTSCSLSTSWQRTASLTVVASGTLRVWTEVDRVVCEFRDSGYLDDPMAGREEPPVDGIGHRGIWMVNQLCDLVQIRVFPSGTVVRVHMQFD